MSADVKVALITAASLVLVALIGVLVELIRSRRGNARDHADVLAKVTALQEDVGDVRTDVREIRTEQNRAGQRLAAVEARLSDHLLDGRRV